MEQRDLLIIGGGPAGCRAAEIAGQSGMRCTLFEANTLGGTCLNCGCITTKTLLYAARIRNRLREDAAKFGLKVSEDGFDLNILRQRVKRVISRLRAAQEVTLARAGVEFVMAYVQNAKSLPDGSFRLEANGQSYLGRHLLIATGSQSRRLSFPGVTPEELLTSLAVPSRLIIAGGGMLGMECAAIWNALGSEVHVIEANSFLGGIPDARAEKLLRSVYEKRGICFHCNTQINSVTHKGINLTNGTALPFGMILYACGRKADRSFIDIPGAIRIGDAKGGEMLAHAAMFDAEQAVCRITGSQESPRPPMPHVLFTDPEIAWIGDLSAQGTEIVHPLTCCGRFAAENPDRNGFCRIILSSDNILQGVCIAGGIASELISLYHVGVQWEFQKKIIFPHPTESEIITK